MAWVTNFEIRDGSGRRQPSNVIGVVRRFEQPDGETVIQIDTHGSEDRANPGKQSQTLQLGRDAAKQLFDLLKRRYAFV